MNELGSYGETVAMCGVCKQRLDAAPSRSDGMPAFCGYLPCPEHPRAETIYVECSQLKSKPEQKPGHKYTLGQDRTVHFCNWCPDPENPSAKHHPGGQAEHLPQPEQSALPSICDMSTPFRERLSWLRCLIASYETEHDWDGDEDPASSEEMLDECRSLLADLADVEPDPQAPHATRPTSFDPYQDLECGGHV